MKKRLIKEYFKIIFPAFLGSIGMQIYYFTDGIFAGHACNDAGMSTLSLSWTFINFIVALATGIGMGGSIKFALNKDDEKKRNLYFFQTIKLLFIGGLILFIILILIYKKQLVSLGASGYLLEQSLNYSKIAIYTTLIQMFAYGLLPMLRNIGAEKAASRAMGIGYIINFVLDYLLMIPLKLEMTGCVIAYISGQIYICFVCFKYVLRYIKTIKKEKYPLSLRLLSPKDIIFAGLGPMGIHISLNICSTAVTKNFLLYGGNAASAAYSSCTYIAGISTQIIQAIIDSSQPLISHSFGQKEYNNSHNYALLMYLSCFVLLFITDVLGVIFSKQLIDSFALSNEATLQMIEHLNTFFIFYACYLFTRITTIYLSSINQSFFSTAITYIQPLLILLLTFVLPKYYGLSGVWNCVQYGYLLSFIISIITILITKKAR